MTSGDPFETGGGLKKLKGVLASGEDPLVGQFVGSYQIKELIAEGGMGRVYNAVRSDGQFDREVAIKILPVGLGEEHRQRFEQERQILASLSHPNIAQLFDAGLADSGNLFLVIELVDGMPIDDYARENSLGTTAKTELMLSLSNVLAFAHSKLVVHRDLKPSNVFVTSDGELKLLDFGIAKILDAPDSVTVERRPMTPRYASPEQLLNEPISVASDIYQLGLLFLSLFDQLDDVQAETHASATERAVKKASITAESRIAARLPTELNAIINKCLRAEPSERYESAIELATDLRNFLGGFPVSARDPGAIQRASKFLRRNWVPASLAAVLGGVIAVSTVFYVVSIKKEQQAALLANERAQAEAAVASSTTDFLLKMISGSNAMLTPGEPITVRDAVARGAELLTTELGDQPLVRARIATSLASALNSMGEWAATKDMLDSILPDLVDDPAIDFGQRMALLLTRTYANYRQSDFDLARDEYQEIIRSHQDANMEDTATHALAWRRLSLLERRATNIDLAVEHMAKANQWYNSYDADDETIAEFLGDYGLVLVGAGDNEAAVGKFEQSSEMFRSIQGDLCTRCAVNMVNLAWALRNLERYDEALEVILEADAIYRQQLGDNYGHFEASILQELSSVKQKLGRYEEAVQDQQKAIDILSQTLGIRHSTYALALYNFAVTHKQHGHCELAIPLLQDARQIHLELFGRDSEWVQRDDRKVEDCRNSADD